MQNDSIVITAKLNVDASEGLILKDLEKIGRDLENNPLKISCAINEKSIEQIKSQLSKDLTINANVNTQDIQQSISNATRNQQVRVNVTTEINKGELTRQAKEIEKTLGIVYPKGQTEALRTELKGLLSEYQKVFDTSGYSREAENQMSKILQFALSHKQEEQLVNEELKHQQERIKEIQREQQKVFITAKQYAALQKEAEAQGTNAKVMLDRALGGSTGWTNDINKVSNPNKPYYWSNFAQEVNSINPLKDAIVNEGDIVQGVRDLADIFSKSFTQIDDSIEKNKAELNNWAIFLMETVGKVTGRSPFADSGWIDIGTDEIKQTEQNVQALAKGMQTIAALKESIKSSDPNGVQSVTADWTQDAERNLNGFVLNVHKATGEVERLHYALDETGESFERIQITGSDSGVERMLVKATQAANNLERKMINLKAAADDQSAPRPITSEESIGKVTEAYNKATSAIEKLRAADATTFTELDNEAKKAVDELNNVIKTARNADTAATKLRAKPIETIKAEETAGLSELSTTISNSVIPNVENLTSRIETLRSELGEVKDKQGLTDYLNKLTALEADFKAIETQAKAVKRAISDLDKVSGSTQFKNNASNPDVVSQMSNISAIRNEYTQLLNSLGQAKSPETIQAISNKLAELKPRFDAVISSSNALNNTLKNDDATAKFGAKLDALRNRMEAFANANQKAIESTRKMRSGNTFAEEWQNMLSQLNNPNIDANGLQRLTEQFRNFTGEARTAGTVTSHLFDSMGNQIKMLASRWLSLYAVIGKIKQMVNYVIELDDAMTKLKRVTDETAEGYERFLKIADQSAKETNTTLVDAVEQAARFAKMGYSATESAKLAKTSLIYSVVGDIDNETAVNDLVTALKGFRLEAEDAMSVVDKLDALNNKYATDAKSLGEALTVSASAMSAAGNDIDQSLAMITGATEITQNAKETAQAIRTITMRIRGMKGELQELGEESDGIESISKIQTQILNYTKGKVNIFDQNNEFKSTYQILKEISDVYNELSQTDQAALTEVIFGKLRANQGLAVISAFQSGQIEKALNDSRNAAGTATEEMERYGESITAHLNQFKEAVQKLSADLIESGLVKTVIDNTTVFVKDLDLIVNDFKALREIVPQVLKDITNYINGNESLLNGENTLFSNLINPIKGITNLIEKGHDLRTELFGADADTLLVENVPEATEKIDSLTERYLELYAAGESNASMSTQLGDIQDNLNDKYMDASKSVDILNKSLSENLAIAEQLKREEVGKWLDENTEKYEKAAKELEKASKIRTDAYGNMIGSGDAYTLNAVGLGGYTKSQYEAFAKLGLSNYHSAEGGVFTYDFALSGTLQEQLDSLIKIRDVYSTLEDQDADRLKQMNTEIDTLKDKIYQAEQLNSVLKEQQQLYASLQSGGQKYNMIEQAKIAYDEYQKAVEAGDSAAASNALTMLNTVKDTLYSVTEPTDLVREQFNQLWETFSFGATEAISAIDDVKERFAELSGDEFDNTLKNVTAIESAIESIMGDELLSHEDAWKLINLDTDGILTDIEIIGNKYRLNTDQMLQLMQQQIDKQKESILTTKAQAEQELRLLELSKARLKVNSAADVAHYQAKVAEIEANMKNMQGIIDESDYLLMELNGHLSITSKIADATAKSMQNAVKNFEAEIEAIDNTIDSLNDRKDVLEEEKSALQDQLDILNEQKSVLEQTIKNYDTAADAVENYVKTFTDGIQDQIDALEEERKTIEDYYDKQIDALQKQNDERDLAIRKEKALADLANAQNQKKRVYSSARGWTYEADKEAVANAQNALNEVVNDEKIQALEKEREEKLTGFDERKTAYEKQIAAYEEYAKQYTSIAPDIQEAEAELLADQILGSDWREKIEKKDEELLTNYRNQYTSFNTQLQTLVNTEIKALQDSIDKKDEEINKIGDEIKAYNKYKTTVQKAMKDAETALKNYQTAMSSAKTNIINDSSATENAVFNDAVKEQQWFNDTANTAEDASRRICNAHWEIGNSARGLSETLQRELLTGNIDLATYVRMMGSFADGGVANYTGLAMLHGTKQKSETIFNANDSAKLYDLVHNTPNLIASMAKQATQLAGFNPSNINNNTANSINVNIGQIVANNPQEFTRNLDRTLDSYFRQKLTQSYVQ